MTQYHSKTFIEEINRRSEAKYNKAEFVGDWSKHWLATAKAWRDELQAEGLTKTVEGLNKVIEFFEKNG